METLLRDTNLIKRAFWLVKLRWVAIVVLLTVVFTAVRMLRIPLPTTELGVIAAGLIIYNFVLFIVLKSITSKGVSPCHTTINRIVTFQIFADIILLTVILHYSGGIENPFYLYFVFHMIIASILLSTRQSYLQATVAIFLFGLVILLEYFGHIRHFAIEEIGGNNLYCDGSFVLRTFLVFSTTLYLVVYMTTSISRLLTRQQQWYENANAQLKEKDHLKNEYVLRLTHDIKGHLAAIQSCLDIVNAQTVGPLNEQQADLVERSYRRAGKCMAFISALLKLTKMKMTNSIEIERFSIKKVIFNALAAVQNKASIKEITVDHSIDVSIDEVYGEPILIEESIANLLFNAVRYTPRKGAVKIGVKDQNEFVLFEVEDTGIGIPQEDIEKIFDEFYRSPNAKSVERDGTGLGLSIARQIIERHGGQIWAQNKPTGGSVFSFTWPKKRQQISAS